MSVKDLKSLEELNELKGSWIALNFHADWCEPCAQMNEVFKKLASIHSDIKFANIDVEEDEVITEKFQVTAVPTYLLLKPDLSVAGRTDGANAPQLTQMIQSQSKQSASVSADDDLQTRLRSLTTEKSIMLFIKGEPNAPQCGFSAKLIALLSKYEGLTYGHFDILSDPAVRAGLKEYARWPTYPQCWVNGKLLGGLDVLVEMDEEGELEPVLRKAAGDDTAALNARIATLIGTNDIVLFMKGKPAEPKCGFSRKMVALLKSADVPFRSFDILQDNAVRQGIKTYSNFPTFPQLYANGKLVGGLDIANELAEEGELKEALGLE